MAVGAGLGLGGAGTVEPLCKGTIVSGRRPSAILGISSNFLIEKHKRLKLTFEIIAL
jgi:hypothetical protein